MILRNGNEQNKSGPETALFWIRQELFLAFFLFRFRRSFLLLDSRIELDSGHHDAVVLHAALVGPLFGLEVALHGEQRAFGELVERPGILVFAPRFHVHQGGYAVGVLAVLLLTGDCQRETGYTCGGELADFSVFSYESGYYEIVLDLFHCDCFLKLMNHFYGAEKVGAAKGKHQG